MWQPQPPRPLPSEAEYCERRAAQEAAAARDAANAEARERHEELAIMYRFRSLAARGEWPPPMTELVADEEQAAPVPKIESTLWL